jgi:2-keto-3-deoxy-L-rhamnonate aldolase RhmA
MPSFNSVDEFRVKIRNGQVCVGTAITFHDPAVSELYGDAGYDFTWIDMEHGPFDLHTILGHIMAVRGTETASFVRVPSNDPVVIKPVLDLVPAAIIVPMVKTPQDAAMAVQACRYPPRGIRGYAPRRGTKFGAISQAQYLDVADEQTMVFVQIEQIDAVQNIEAILQTPGLNGICVGPNDLSGSMGRMGRTRDPDVVAAVEAVLRKARQTGLFVGVATGYDPDTLPTWLDLGVQWICLNADYVNMYQHSRIVLEGVRQFEQARRLDRRPGDNR